MNPDPVLINLSGISLRSWDFTKLHFCLCKLASQCHPSWRGVPNGDILKPLMNDLKHGALSLSTCSVKLLAALLPPGTKAHGFSQEQVLLFSIYCLYSNEICSPCLLSIGHSGRDVITGETPGNIHDHPGRQQRVGPAMQIACLHYACLAMS